MNHAPFSRARAPVWFVMLASGIAVGSCTILSGGLAPLGPVAAGTTFVVEVTGLTDYQPGTAVAVLQLPNGFEVVDATALSRPVGTFPGGGFRDDPGVLAACTAESNHYLTSFSGMAIVPQSASDVTLRVYVRAPATPGLHRIKLSLGTGYGSYQAQIPAGITNFAQITATPAARSVNVVGPPAAPPFTFANDGLWGLGATNWSQPILSDLDGDGRDDLIALGGSTAHAWLRSTTDWLSITGNLAAVPITGSIAAGDFDGDGFGDVVTSTGQVVFGSGSAVWTLGPVLSTGSTLADVAAADVDADGRPDIVFADSAGYRVHRSNTNRTFTPFDSGLPATAGSSGCNLVATDLDGDRVAEIVSLPTLGAGVAPRVWRSNGLGSWQLVGALPTSWFSVVVLDVNGDGRPELVPSSGGQAVVYAPTSLVPKTVPTLPAFLSAVPLDHDRDGRTDLFVSQVAVAQNPVVQLFRQTATGFTPVPLQPQAGFHVLWSVLGLATGDLDGDTFPDLAATFGVESPMVWRNTATGAAPYGSGCAGPGFPTPSLTAQGTVAPGQSIDLQLGGAGPNGFALLWLGTSNSTWFGAPLLPLSLGGFGAPGCVLLAEPRWIAGVVADGSGVATVPLMLPNLMAFQPGVLFGQGAVLAVGANALGLSFSNGLVLKLQ